MLDPHALEMRPLNQQLDFNIFCLISATANAGTRRLRKQWSSITAMVSDFNLFRNPNKRAEDELALQRIATRAFALLSSSTLIVLITYSSLQNMTHTITIENPIMDQVNSLYLQYPQSTRCPCTTLSNKYEDFILLQPMSLHPVCASVFLIPTSQWSTIDYPAVRVGGHLRRSVYPGIDDFRHIASPFFQVVNSLCQMSEQAISVKLLTFRSAAFITPNLIFYQPFNVQTSQFISQFIEDAARSFTNTLFLNNNMTRGNMLFSALLSDSVFTEYPNYHYDVTEYSYVYDYDVRDQVYNSSIDGTECDCETTAWCVQQAVVYELDGTTPLFRIPGKSVCVYIACNKQYFLLLTGVYVGCYMMEAVLKSDLRCFFDVECLQALKDKLYINASSAALDHNATRYSTVTPLFDIVSNLMVEKWFNQTSYENYFNRCHPTSCTVTYVGRGDIIQIITTTIGLIGGFTKVYKFAVPLAVTAVLRLFIPMIKRKIIGRNRVTTF